MKKIAVVGATGLVGRTILKSVVEENLKYDELYLFSSRKNAGSRINVNGREYVVSELTPDSFEHLDIDVTLMSAGSGTSMNYAEHILKGSRYLVDNSSAFRRDPSIPLVVPEINFDYIKSSGSRIIANPNCSTIQLVLPLHCMRNISPLRRVIVTCLQSVSGSGIRAIDELRAQTGKALSGEEIHPEVYEKPIAFNIIPRIGNVEPDGFCSEEHKVMFETGRILDSELAVCATTVRVPVFYCHSESVWVEFERDVEKQEIISQFKNFDAIEYFDQDQWPMPVDFAGWPDTYVGRLREDKSLPKRAYKFWIVADNLKRGAATNAVRIASGLLDNM